MPLRGEVAVKDPIAALNFFFIRKITPKICLLVNYPRFFAMYALIYAEKYTKYGIVFYAH